MSRPVEIGCKQEMFNFFENGLSGSICLKITFFTTNDTEVKVIYVFGNANDEVKSNAQRYEEFFFLKTFLKRIK